MEKSLLFIFSSLFIISFILSINAIVDLSSLTSGSEETETADYHFAFFLPREFYSFFRSVASGAQEAAEEMDCALSFHTIGNDSLDLEMARFSGIDGVVLYPSINEEEARRILDEFDDSGISVVLIEHTLSDSSPWPFVGTNNFDIGKKIGNLIKSRSGSPLQIAVVYSMKSPGIYAEKDLVGLGITSTLGPLLETPLESRITNLNPLDAEELTYEMLLNEPWISTIVFTDTSDTLAATQVLIDMNMVGTVRLIGFGTEDAILDYVEKGILEATIATNPWDIGYNAVKVLVKQQSEGHMPGYVDTGVEIVTERNVDRFRKNGSRR
ncbi:sugar ABC transporter substrate-binding protein [Marispirochaeta aestuarii]|uniref:Sugar ABC transporter substrate-binding protein n=1 Tax=Marispirochaeta aestuarii TaxID=1963862 RepID=A0A1Y1RXI9_9SPIO|nr:substrate-binding domain-containing protein [Marispirochaeta aestuarii]ORC35039.1 sugar ABC transporter substrate-binding protein [Marispirochaeta aestuarii]